MHWRPAGLSLLLHGALLGLAFSWAPRRNETTADFEIEAPLCSVFVQETGGSEGLEERLPRPDPSLARPQAAALHSGPPSPSAPSPPSTRELDLGVAEGEARPVGRIDPRYPEMSRRLGEEGEAVFLVTISESGSVDRLILERSSGHERLDEAARVALTAARFHVASDRGKPRSSVKRFRVEFRLSGGRRNE